MWGEVLQYGMMWVNLPVLFDEVPCVLFTGEYEHTIDAKQRLAIPAEIRDQLDPEQHGEAMYLAPGGNGHLWLWPERTFERMTGAMEASLLQDEQIMEFEEFIFPQSRRLDIDKAGRIRIPEQMLTEFGLSQTVVILGMKDHLELRDPAQWREQRQQSLSRRSEILRRAREALKHSGGAGSGNGQGSSTGGGGQKERP
jgi:MraZ protein